MSENETLNAPRPDSTRAGNGKHQHQVEPCACCRALATKYIMFRPAPNETATVSSFDQTVSQSKKEPRVIKLPKIMTAAFSVGNNGGKNQKSGNATNEQTLGAEKEHPTTKMKGDDKDHTTEEDPLDEALRQPPKKNLFAGMNGLSVMTLGVILPTLMLFATAISVPKRLTLVVLNHPVESVVELLLLAMIPLVNFFTWRALCRNEIRISITRGLALGAAIGTSLMVAGVCIAALFWGTADLESEIGSNFQSGFCWLLILALACAGESIYLANRFRLTRDLRTSRRWIVGLTACGALMSWLAGFGAELGPWLVRLDEQKAVSNPAKERKEGLSALRRLDLERELRMECSDSRAAGLAGLFIPLKASAQQELYFAVTGKPFSFRDLKNADFSSMPDEYVSHNVVGDKVPGLSLTRSSLTTDVHPRLLSSTMHWTFVFKNETSKGIEARAEFLLPPGAVVTGLTKWHSGEPEEATFIASGKVEGAQMQEAGHETSAMVTDLGRGRALLHCYPVEPAQQLKIDVAMVAPLKPDGATSSSLVMPRFLATNFAIDEDHGVRIQSSMPLSAKFAGLKQSTTPDHKVVLSGRLTEDELEKTPLMIEAERPATQPNLVMLDKIAMQLQHEAEIRKEQTRIAELSATEHDHSEQVVVMINGTNGVRDQLSSVTNAIERKRRELYAKKAVVVKPHFVVQSLARLSSAAPSRLVVVIDGSSSMSSHVKELKQALAAIPNSVPVSVIVASQDNPELQEPSTLDQGLQKLERMNFQGGQDNLKAVVEASELAGETRGGAVLWIHGPQPTLNSNIYIMKQYVSQPKFYEVALDSGEVDTYDFFKNHAEIGPFETVAQDKTLVGRLEQFFTRWQPGKGAFYSAFATTNVKPTIGELLSDGQSKELLQLIAYQTVSELIKSRHSNTAALVATRYGILTPVSTAMIVSTPAQDAQEESNNFTGSIGPSAALLGATNGTINYGTGINTAGTVRVNNLANLEALLNIIANMAELAGLLAGMALVLHGKFVKEDCSILGLPAQLSPGVRMALGVSVIIGSVMVPGMINWFVASARDANLFN